MGSTVVNGVIKRVPYGMVRNFRDQLTHGLEIVVFDSSMNLRDWVMAQKRLEAGVPFYVGDTVKVIYKKGSIGSTAICDVITVHPSTGAESVASTKSFTAARQKALVLACTAINGSSGVATLTTSYEVFAL